MICPACGTILSQSQLLKVNVKGMDNVDIVYDAICPVCRVEMGKMFWGNFTPNPALAEGKNQPSRTGARHRPPIRVRTASDSKENWPQKNIHICPHCGKDLPEDISQLPVRRHPYDRRTQERRQLPDRRKQQVLWPLEERRQSERRQGDRRQSQDRRAGKAEADTSDMRRSDRRQAQRPVLYDRRRNKPDRRKKETAPISRKI